MDSFPPATSSVSQTPPQLPSQSLQHLSQGQIQAQGTNPTPREAKPHSDFSPRPPKSSVSSSTADMIQFLREGPSPAGKPFRNDGAKAKRGPEEFLDFDDDDDGMEDDDDDWNITPKKGEHKKSKAMAAVEDFPLPPSNAPGRDLAQAQAQLQALATQKDPAIMAGYQRSGDMIYKPSDQPVPVPSASFRALPLLSSDLPYTQIQVSNSSIKPNDRGKDVLSFIVAVEPGHGKDGWKVEKLYSDVLGLDSRVRASVGKGMGKKIASLPEGRLWRDHAPAKVDQRKVGLSS